MKIAIIGTRGIPNHYGGFEQCAEYLAAGLVKKGYEVVVYNSHNHPYQQKDWKGVEICHCYDPEFKMGTVGQFLYDLNCIRDVRKRKVDVILQLGYTSSSVWGWLLPGTAIVTTNMDGLEWKRAKYSKPVQSFLKYAEKLAVRYSDHLISDSPEIQRYLREKYGENSCFIPYGAEVFNNPDAAILSDYNLEAGQYDMLIARMEPENSIEVILDGVAKAGLDRKFLVVGSTENDYGEYIRAKFQFHQNIVFAGPIYDLGKLNNLRYHSNLYFHGHTVGGTNPSLLEAMASNSLICSQDNRFNRAVLGSDAFYFSNAADVALQLSVTIKTAPCYQHLLDNNLEKISTIYTCDNIINSYSSHFESIVYERIKATPQKVLTPQITFSLDH
jgi:glycosyltransferase involved in cell wall biosynthesis